MATNTQDNKQEQIAQLEHQLEEQERAANRFKIMMDFSHTGTVWFQHWLIATYNVLCIREDLECLREGLE